MEPMPYKTGFEELKMRAALRIKGWLQHLSSIPDHFLQRDVSEAALRRTLRVAGQGPIEKGKYQVERISLCPLPNLRNVRIIH